MTYVEGFLLAVPTANKEPFREQAERGWPLFQEFGATRLVEGWGDDVPRGKLTDIWGAVQAKEGENVLFSWIEYPDRATRDAAGKRMESDPRLKEMGEMPFDGMRMIWSGFEIFGDTGPGGSAGYVDGFVAAVPSDRHDDYVGYCATIAAAFTDSGALRVVDAWGDDVKPGKVTDFLRATRAEEGETVAFGWVEWPSKDAREAGWRTLMDDPRLADPSAMPFDGKRMIYGAFVPIVDRKGVE